MLDRDVRPRQEAPVLIGVAVDGVFEEIRADAAEVQERVALSRRAIADDSLALAPACDQELEQTPLRLVHLRGERAVTLERVEAQRALAFCELLDSRGHLMRPVSLRCT